MQDVAFIQKIVGLDDDTFSAIVPHINALIELGLNPAHAAYLFFSALGMYKNIEYKLQTSVGLFGPTTAISKKSAEEIKSYLVNNLELDNQRATELVDFIVGFVKNSIDESKKLAKKIAHEESVSSVERDDLSELYHGAYTIPLDDYVGIINPTSLSRNTFQAWMAEQNNIKHKMAIVEAPHTYSYGEGYSGKGGDVGVIVRGTPKPFAKNVSYGDFLQFGVTYGIPQKIIIDHDTIFVAKYADFVLLVLRDLD